MPSNDNMADTFVNRKTEVIALGWWGVADGDDEEHRQQLVNGVANLAEDTSHLDLSANQFGFCELNYLLKVMNAIKTKITALNLSFNQCGNMTASDFACLLNHVPASVLELNLSHNNLSHYTMEQWLAIIQALPESIVHLDLSYNLPIEVEMVVLDALQQVLSMAKNNRRTKLFAVFRANHHAVHGVSPHDGLQH